MEGKKFNIFAMLLMTLMCAVSVFACVTNKQDSVNYSNDILAMYKEIEDLEKQIESSKGKSAYELALDRGFVGSEGDWLLSLNGEDGKDALAPVTVRSIYDAYLETTNQTETSFTFDDFLVYYYSVIKYDTKFATQMAYSTTVDICYSYTSQTYYIQNNGTSYSVNSEKSGMKGGVGAGAGVIYQMLDNSGNDGVLDTAYIITNYHVAYLENYSNDPNYVVYADYSTTFDVNTMQYVDYINEYFLADDFTKNENNRFTKLTIDDAISKHFLIGTNGDYYGIYLYGYQDEKYKLNATFVGGSADNDIAVLKIDRNNISEALAGIFFDSGNFSEVTIGDSSALVGGEEVIAVGNPLIPNTYKGMTLQQCEKEYIDSLVLTSTTGVVSAISDEVVFASLINSKNTTEMRLIRVDAAINSGNSGGGLYDLYGNLVGVVNSKIASSSYDNVGYAIPINIAVNIAEQVIGQCEGNNALSQNTRIKVLRTSNLGFDISHSSSKSELVVNTSGEKQWRVSYNLAVCNLQSDGKSDVSGLCDGDIILEVGFDDNTYLASEMFNLDYELKDLLLKVKLNTPSITFKVLRNTETITVTIELAFEDFIEIC